MVVRKGQFHVPVSVGDAFRLSEEALIVIGGRVSVRDQAAGRLVASTPWSMKSWGETITVAVAGADGNVAVDVTIESRVRSTLIDWGKSADDLKRFSDWETKTQPTNGHSHEMVHEMRMLIDAARSAVANLQAALPPIPKRDDTET